MLARACVAGIAAVLESCTCGVEGWARAAVHGGIFKSNFTLGRRREGSSVAFGKVAAGNELLGIAFSGAMPIKATKRQATS